MRKFARAQMCGIMILETILISSLQLDLFAQRTGTPKVFGKQAVAAEYDLRFDRLADRWDEAVPLGNGMIGSLVWQKGTNLRFSIDRSDLWDLRPIKEFSRSEFSHQWVYKKVMEGNYIPVQKLFDEPYVKQPGPTKIPGGALEFDISNLGDVQPMGGWIQYAFSYTTGGWLAQHYYLQWRYSMDREFLEAEAYPYFKEVATYFENITVRQKDGKRKLPLSSSAEIHNNTINAWFKDYTSLDLSLIRFTLEKAAELAGELSIEADKAKWSKLLTEFPELPVGQDGGLLLAINEPLREPHRHHSHLVAIHPLGLISREKGEQDKTTISSSLKHLEDLGLYKHFLGKDIGLHTSIGGMGAAWYANLLARSGDGEKACQVLNYFAKAYVSKNSFHLNYDQLKGKPRVFTLEANFGFAAAVQEMLLQSQNGFIRVFPAVPSTWQDISFTQLRAEGAFLVSAEKENGVLRSVEIFSEKGGDLRLKNPFGERSFKATGIDTRGVSSI